MSTLNTPDNSKGKVKADDPSSPDNSKNSDNSSTSGNSSSSGSTTPRASPLVTVTPAPAANASSSNPSSGPSRGAIPRPVGSIDQSVMLEGLNFLPSAAERMASAASGSGERIFRRLQHEFTELSKKEDLLRAQRLTYILQERTAKAAQKNAEDAAEKNKRELEKAQQEMHVANAKWDAAVEVEKDNEEEKKRLRAWEAELSVREANLKRRETELQRRQAVLQCHTGDNLEAQFAAVGLSGGIQQTHDPMSNEGDLSSPESLLQHHSQDMFAAAIDNPPRGRALTSPHILQQQILSTTPSDLAFRSRSNRFSPIRPGPVVPRRGSSANLSIATPTPLRVRRGLDMRGMAAFGATPDDVCDSSRGEEAGESSTGEEVQAEEAERPRGRSVRRVSRNENLRRET
ncbi:hypothetical protein MBLNU13_g09718t1 [Cladosporium sp. NU13]